MMGHQGWMFGMGWMGWIWLLGLAIAILVIWLAYDQTSRQSPSSGKPSREGPKEILRRRLASGEIEEEEFKRRLNALQQEM
jgi:putative membrane protein